MILPNFEKKCMKSRQFCTHTPNMNVRTHGLRLLPCRCPYPTLFKATAIATWQKTKRRIVDPDVFYEQDFKAHSHRARATAAKSM